MSASSEVTTKTWRSTPRLSILRFARSILSGIFGSLMALSLPTTVRAQQPPDYSQVTLSPGDAIRIDVFRNKELSGEFPIAADGTITHPLYRELKVTGIPLSVIQDRLRDFIGRFQESPLFVVTPLLRTIVAGEVRQPNMYTVPPGTTVAQLIAMAGGITDRGRLDRVQLLRGSTSSFLDLTRPDANAMHIEIRSGDEIVVGRRRSIMQDYIAPSSSILAATAAIASVIIQLKIR